MPQTAKTVSGASLHPLGLSNTAAAPANYNYVAPSTSGTFIPTITWQTTTSNATYCSAASVLT